MDNIKDLSEVTQKMLVIAKIDPLQMARIIGQAEQAKRDEDAITRLEERVKELEQKAG